MKKWRGTVSGVIAMAVQVDAKSLEEAEEKMYRNAQFAWSTMLGLDLQEVHGAENVEEIHR